MPTSTLPFEVDFELTNDTSTPASLQSVNASGIGATLSLQKGESVVMLLNAGERYTYAVQSGFKSAQITICTWHDIQCSVTAIFENISRTDVDC